jgi:hypothetical protein
MSLDPHDQFDFSFIETGIHPHFFTHHSFVRLPLGESRNELSIWSVKCSTTQLVAEVLANKYKCFATHRMGSAKIYKPQISPKDVTVLILSDCTILATILLCQTNQARNLPIVAVFPQHGK